MLPDLTAIVIPTGQIALTGPSEKLDPALWPVRGDLAHIALAGRCFVPHYAVPIPFQLAAASELKVAARPDADTRAAVEAGETFNVLDVSGGWAWGQLGEDGWGGYLPLTALAGQ